MRGSNFIIIGSQNLLINLCRVTDIVGDANSTTIRFGEEHSVTLQMNLIEFISRYSLELNIMIPKKAVPVIQE